MIDVLPTILITVTFEGFPVAALDFYDDLELDNTKAFWAEHRSTYDSAVAAPMRALVADLADEFGDAKIFRPYRDVRFTEVNYLRTANTTSRPPYSKLPARHGYCTMPSGTETGRRGRP